MSHSIPYFNLLYLIFPLLITGWLYFKWCGVKWEMAYASLRMVAQLILIGYALVFLFQNDDTWIGILILLVMILMSSIIAIRPFKKHPEVLLPTIISVSISGTVILGIVCIGVMRLEPLYQPRLVIPIAGMIYSNSMNTISLAGERYLTDLENGKNIVEARAQAYKAALIPQVNSFLAVGLVSLPGMMTGQILSGVSPLIAVRYQIMVMAMVMGSAGFAAGIFLSLLSKPGKGSSPPQA